MAGLKIDFQIKGLPELLRKINRLQAQIAPSGAGGKTELHRRYGIQALNWIDDNFRQSGTLTGKPWASLAKNTTASRRKASKKPLLDSGLLRASFTSKPTAHNVRVGTPFFFAPYHEEGGKKWYDIEPKNAKLLAFQVDKGSAKQYKTTVRNSNTGKERVTFAAHRIGASFSSIATRKTYRQGQYFVLTKKVRHPPLEKRPMLPKQQYPSMMTRLLKTTINYLRESGLFRGG